MVAGGGTGGHVTPALALAERIAARGDEVLLLGTERGLERRLVPEAGFELLTLPARQVMGKGLAARLAAGPALAAACVSAWRMLGRRKIDLVVSVGGYASVPAVVAAAVRRLPIAVVEPNAIPGRANRLAARLAARIFVQFDEAAEALAAAGGGGRVRTAGIPLRSALIRAFAAAPARRVPAAAAGVCWSSAAARERKQINDAMIEASRSFAGAPLEIFHQTGEADRARVAEAYAAAGLSAEVVAFEPDMPTPLPLGRRRPVSSGRAHGRGVVPGSATFAAGPLPPRRGRPPAGERAGSGPRGRRARAASPRRSRGRRWPACCVELFAAPGDLVSMSAAASKLAQPDAAERIVAECAALAQARRRGMPA